MAVIVSCPGCSTHYSHEVEGVLQIGRCSQCDERFPLAAIRRRYVVMPATPAGPADPLLAAGLAATRAQVDRPVDVPAPPAEPLPPTEDPTAPAAAETDADDDAFFGAGFDDDEALFGADEATVDPAEAAEEQAAPVERGRRCPTHPVREALGVFLLAALGAAAGFHGGLQFGFEPLKAVAVGLTVGLTLGWAWIRWAERKR